MVGLKPPEVPPTAAVKFFSAGTAACIADLCTFPLDTAKVRLQVKPREPHGRMELPQRREPPRRCHRVGTAGARRAG